MAQEIQTMTWPELLSAVEGNQGIYQVPMETLRQLEGRQRVGKHILSAIDEKLATLGLGHLPEELPNRHQQTVLLYRFGTPASEVIRAIREGLTESPDEATYTYLHRLNSIPDPEDVVRKDELREKVQESIRPVIELLNSFQPPAVESVRARPAKRTQQRRGPEQPEASREGLESLLENLARA